MGGVCIYVLICGLVGMLGGYRWTLVSALTCYILIEGQVTQVSPDSHKEKPVTV